MNRIQHFVQSQRVSSPYQRTTEKALLLGSRLNAVTDWKAVARKGDHSVSRIAVICGASERQLRRYIQAKFNQSPRVWLEDLRLAEAEALLIRREPMKVIIDICGSTIAPTSDAPSSANTA